MNRSKLQQQIEATKNELEKLQEQLNNCFPSLEESISGDELEGGWVVVEKYPNAALLAAPRDTQQWLRWNDRNKVLEGLPGDCFIPSVEQLQLAHKNVRHHFSSTLYWSSTEASATNAFNVFFVNGSQSTLSKTDTYCVRAFRLVVF